MQMFVLLEEEGNSEIEKKIIRKREKDWELS